MRFPVRFTSDFQLGVAARILRTRDRQPLILKLAPFTSDATDRFPPVESAPSMIWIGGFEPLEHPDIPKFTNALAASAREVFLQTDGKFLRRRVHEFQPSPRFRFAFHFTGSGISSPENADVIEAIRIAKLSGFLTVGFTTLQTANELENSIALHSQLKKLDLDGSLILAADASPECERVVAAARDRVLDRRWSNISRIFNSAAQPASAQADYRAATSPRRHVAQSTTTAAATDFDLDEGAQA
jgi:hypothetical protein